jgi:phosphoglycerol transferase
MRRVYRLGKDHDIFWPGTKPEQDSQEPMNQAIQLLALIASALLILRLTGNRHVSAVVGFFLAVFISLQLASLYLIDGFINYQFYTHLNWGDIRAYLFQFIPQFIAALVFFLVTWRVSLWLARKSRAVLRTPRSLDFGLLAGMLLIMCLPNGVLREAHEIYGILTAGNQTFDAALADLGIDPENYTTPRDIHADPGKNIVVISMESLERGFLGEQFPGLTPNLNRLSRELNRYDMPLVPGTGWTAGSLYAHQVGMPALFKGQGNDFFQDIEGVKLTGLGHVLREAGYYTRYIMGMPGFAGTADLLGAYRIPIVSEHSSLGEYPESKAGLNDLDLFEETKLQVLEAESAGRPFALFLSTINTHYPDGIHDPRMEERIGTDRDGLEFSVAALDWLIGDFFDFLSARGLLDNTVVYLFSDHLLMGRTGKILEKLKKEERSSLLISNADSNVLGRKPGQPVYIIELPRLILDGAGISSNARFLTDFIDEKNLSGFTARNAPKLTALNQASVHRFDFSDGFSIELSGDTLTIESQNKTVRFDRVAARRGRAFNVIFNERMNFVSHSIIPRGLFFQKGKHEDKHPRLHLTMQVDEEQVTAYFGDKNQVGIALSGERSVTFSKEDIALVRQSVSGLQGPYSKLREDQGDETVYASNVARITSAPLGSPGSIKLGQGVYSMNRGLNVFFQDRDAWKVETFDTWWSVDSADRFVERVKSLHQEQAFFIIAAQEAIRNDHPGYAEKLQELSLPILAQTRGRTAYIAYPGSDSRLLEFTDEKILTHVIPVAVSGENPQPDMAVSPHATDTDRFIAHAGGAIDGSRYTNSLEALDNSYRAGFRLFELDISKTADHQLVASHDWEHWKRISGYQGPIPPTLEQFRSRNLKGRYTPLDMDGINDWFQQHPDAILVTDKINDPVRFAEQFVDRKRLMMELFSVEALEAGIQAGILAPIANWNVVKGLEPGALQEMGIRDIAVSRRVVDTQADRLRALRHAGIRAFAFHINADPGKDETHVVCEELDYFFGLYADTWNFEQPPVCGQQM